MKENRKKSAAWLPWVPEVFSHVFFLWHPASVVRLVPTLFLRLPSLVSGIVIVMKFKMAAAAMKFVWLETIRNSRKTSLVQDGKK